MLVRCEKCGTIIARIEPYECMSANVTYTCGECGFDGVIGVHSPGDSRRSKKKQDETGVL